jgi:hypothetical protein
MILIQTNCPNCGGAIAKSHKIVDDLFKEKKHIHCDGCKIDITDHFKIITVETLDKILSDPKIINTMSLILEICGTCKFYFKKQNLNDRQAYSCRRHNRNVRIVDYCNNFDKRQL